MTRTARTLAARLAAPFLLFALATGVAQTPPWGDAAYDAEVTILSDGVPLSTVRTEVGAEGFRYTARDEGGDVVLEAIVAWEDGTAVAYVRDGDAFVREDALLGVLLQSVLDPLTPGVGLCASEGVTCEVLDEADTAAGRPARRMRIDQAALGTSSVVWVDLATGLTIASEAGDVRSELAALREGPPDPSRLRP